MDHQAALVHALQVQYGISASHARYLLRQAAAQAAERWRTRPASERPGPFGRFFLPGSPKSHA